MTEEGHREQWIGRVGVVSALGAVDMLTAPALEDSISAVLDKDPAAVVVDLTDVDFLASAGMQVLVNTHRRLAPGTRFAVAADGPATSRPLIITGLTDVIALFPTLDEAVAHVLTEV